MKTLLLVDPDPLIRQLLKLVFDDHYRLIETGSGERALGLIYTEQPDLVLAELLLPDLPGTELCRLIKTGADWRPVPLIFLTVAADSARRAHALRAGADAYITKPFSPTALLRDVRRLTTGNPPFGQTMQL